MLIRNYTGPLIQTPRVFDPARDAFRLTTAGSIDARMDATNLILGAESALEKVLNKIIDFQFPEITWRRVFPESGDRSPGVETISWREMKGGGKYTPYASGADLPQPNVGGAKRSIYSVPHAMAVGWGYQEMLRAALTGSDLSSLDLRLLKQAYEERVEECVWLGDPAYQICGLLNDVAIGKVAIVKDGAINSGKVVDATACKWDGSGSATAAEIERSMISFVHELRRRSNNIHQPRGTLVLDPDAYAHVTTKDLSLNPTRTIAESFTAKTGIKLDQSIKLLAVTTTLSGQSAVKNFAALIPNDPGVLEVHNPAPLQIFGAQQRGLDTLVPTYAEIAGVAVYQPAQILLGYY